MDRVINVKVNGSHLSKDNNLAGVQHEANSTFLRIEFDPGWDGYAKKVTWWDALGLNPVEITLTVNLLEDSAKSKRIYLAPIPGEPLAEAGKCTFVIDGYIEGKRVRSLSDKLTVKPAPFVEKAAEPADPTPTQAEQLQRQAEALFDAINNIPEGVATPIVNDLTTGGASMALSAEMGKVLKSELDGLTPEDIGAVAAVAKDISNQDLLTYLVGDKGGFFRGYNVTNAPTADWFYYTIISNGALFGTVIATALFTGSVYVGYYANNTFGGWKKLATTDYAVNKAGDTMTGALYVEKSWPAVNMDDTSSGGRMLVVLGNKQARVGHQNVQGDDNNRRLIVINSSDIQGLNRAIQLWETVDGGATKYYDIFHTGNKPSGSYTGNGSAAARTIAIGGVGEVMVVYGSGNMALVTPTGVIGKNSSGTVFTLAHGEFKFDNGVLTIATTNSALNNNGTTYYYQVL